MVNSGFRILVASIFVFMFVGLAAADVPLFIPLQGKLLNSSGAAITGAQTLNFTLFDAATNGVQVYQENRVGANRYVVTNGFFDVNLGDNSSLAGVNFTYPLWLQINVSGEILTPRMRLSSAPYARTAERVFGVQASLNESLITLNKNGAATGLGNVITISNIGAGEGILVTQTGDGDGIQIETPTNNSDSALDINHDSNASAAIDIDLRDNVAGVLVYKTGASGAGAIINVSENSGTGPDISARESFNVTNGVVGAVRMTTRLNLVGFIGNGSGIEDLDASKVTTGVLANGRLSASYAQTIAFTALTNRFFGDGTGLNFSYVNATGTIAASNVTSVPHVSLTGTLHTSNLTGAYTGALIFRNLQNQFFGDGTGLNFSYVNATGTIAASNVTSVPHVSLTGTLHTSNLTGTYSGDLVFTGIVNRTHAASSGFNILRRTAAQADTGGTGVVTGITQYAADTALDVIQTTNNLGARVFKNGTGAGIGLNVSTLGTGQAVDAQQYTNNDAVLIEKIATGAGDALQIENSGTGAALNLVAVGTGNATIASSTGNGHWVGNSVQVMYVNQTVDVTHGADLIQIDNQAVTGNSIILLSINGTVAPDTGAGVSLFVSARLPRNHFNVTVVNSTNRENTFAVSYIMIN